MDEKFMVMEQERLARERKRRQNRKRWKIAGIVLLLVMIGVAVFFFVRSKIAPKTTENTVKIQVGDGQEIVFAGLTSVKGNEITYRIAEEREEEEDEEASEEEENSQEEGERPGKGQFGGEGMPDMGSFPGGGEGMPDMGSFPGGGEGMPDMGSFPGGGEGMPDMSQFGGEGMLDMGSFPGGGEGMPDMSQFPGMGGGNRGNGGTQSATTAKETFIYEDATYELTRQQVTTQIPVGTDVITKLGTVTTFSRLAAGDVVALVVEEEDDEQIIAGVYIIG